MVKVFAHTGDQSTPLVGQVHDITRAGVVVHLTDGKFMTAQPNQIEEEKNVVARLPTLPSRAQVAARNDLAPKDLHADDGRALINDPTHPAHEKAVQFVQRHFAEPSSDHPDVVHHSVWQLFHHEVPVELADGSKFTADRKIAPLVKKVNDAGLKTRFSAATEKDDVRRFKNDAQLFFDGKSADDFIARLPANKYKVREASVSDRVPPKRGELVVQRDANGGEIVLINQDDLAKITHDFADKTAPAIKLRKPPAGMRPATAEDRARLKIPPGWQNVHVALDPNAALQGWGQDSKGRSQPRYTPEHHAAAADKKFARMRELHKVLPQLDAALERDAPNDGTAAAVLLMRKMGVRNGSESDTGAKTFAYGASNLRAKHVILDGDKVTLDFDAKDNVHLTLPVEDEQLKQILRKRIAGLKPDDPIFNTNESKTNAYLKQHTGDDFKIKDLRTYLANSLALSIIQGMPKPTSLAQYKKQRLEVARRVSAALGNTPTVALASYINPAIFNVWTENAEWSV